MDLETIVEMESAPDRVICDFRDFGEYRLFCSPRFPHYYSGNGLDLKAAAHPLAFWEERFAEHFPAPRYEHRTFTFDDEPAFGSLADEARASQYHVDHEVFLYLDEAPAPVADVPAGFDLREISSEAEWEMMRRFDDDSNRDEDWFEEGDSMLFEKDRVISDALAMRWFYLAETATGRMAAKTGIFTRDDMVSVQEVMTAPDLRRRGLATALVRTVIERLRDSGLHLFTLSADRDDEAIRIYRRLGFSEIGSRITMMTYPGIVTD